MIGDEPLRRREVSLKEGDMIGSIFEAGNTASGGCDCCRLSPESIPENYGCTERKEILTPREQEVLKRIREAGERARYLKKQLGQPRAVALSAGDRKGIEEELGSLRQLRSVLEEERLAAAEERMRYLGHA